MKLQQSFEVAAPVERVWSTLIDVEAVAPCLPGAEITGADDDGAYRGTFSVKLGPATAAYAGSLRLEKVDDASRTTVMRAEGSDTRGQGAARATIESTVSEAGHVTRVAVVTDFTITGRLARFGRGGMIQDISNRLLKDFADCLQQKIETAPETGEPGLLDAVVKSTPEGAAAAAPIGGVSLFFGALLDRLRRLFRRG